MVISQTPSSGKVKKGDTVKVVLSQGEESKTVPNVVGATEEMARSTIANAGLNYALEYEYSDTVAKGNVISQNVDAGKTVAPKTTVTITISQGSSTKYYSFSYTLKYELGHEVQADETTGTPAKTVTAFAAILKDGSGNAIEGASWQSAITSNDSYNMTANNIPNATSGNLVVTWTYSDGTTEDQTIGVSFSAQ